MIDVQFAHSIFVECARRVAFDRCALTARLKGLDFVLAFTDSQLARDGLAAAATLFANAVADGSMAKHEIISMAELCAQKAPVETWWQPQFFNERLATLRGSDASQTAHANSLRSN